MRRQVWGAPFSKGARAFPQFTLLMDRGHMLGRGAGWRGFGKNGRHMKSARSRKKSPYGVRGGEFGPCLSSAARHYITFITLLSSPFAQLISIQHFPQIFILKFVTLHNPQKCTKKRAKSPSISSLFFNKYKLCTKYFVLLVQPHYLL